MAARDFQPVPQTVRAFHANKILVILPIFCPQEPRSRLFFPLLEYHNSRRISTIFFKNFHGFFHSFLTFPQDGRKSPRPGERTGVRTLKRRIKSSCKNLPGY
jgi:hypothetical protein